MNTDDSESYAAFTRPNQHGAKATLELAFHHDYAAEVDAKNGWSAKDAPDVELQRELIASGSKSLNEFFRFCWGHRLYPNGRGLGEALAKFLAVASMVAPDSIVKGGRMVRNSDGTRSIADATQLSTTEIARLANVTVPRLKKLRADFMSRWGLKAHVTKRTRKVDKSSISK
ncbi:MAG: hypothetical protein QOG67_2540 [Verrucomicrobiota bacterium]|jgi:hypothetical protein